MPRIELETRISAPVERVFDLSRSIDLHQHSQSAHGEVAVAGRTSGLIEAGEHVTWQAKHLGVRQNLTSRIASMDRPRHFRDSMVKGAFKRMDHDHYFETASSGQTVMRDVFDYESPFGVIGRLVDLIFLRRYMERLLADRNRTIKEFAEAVKNPES